MCRCLYNYFCKLADDVKSGRVKDLTAGETFILNNFSSQVIPVQLTNKFIVDVSSPIMKLINHFESEEPNIFSRYKTIIDFTSTFLAKFLKNGGLEEGQDVATPKTLLNIDVLDRRSQLSNQEMFVGPKVEAFIQKLGLSKQSTELLPFFDRVREFYVEALLKIQKYFCPSLTSKLLRYCEIIDPTDLKAGNVRKAHARKYTKLRALLEYIIEFFARVL